MTQRVGTPRARVCCTSQKQSSESVETGTVLLQWQDASLPSCESFLFGVCRDS